MVVDNEKTLDFLTANFTSAAKVAQPSLLRVPLTASRLNAFGCLQGEMGRTAYLILHILKDRPILMQRVSVNIYQ